MSEEKKDMVIEELRSAVETVKNGQAQLAEERARFEQERAAAQTPVVRESEKDVVLRDLKNAMLEKRAVTLSGTGMVQVMQELAKVVMKKNDFLGEARYFYGPNANTVIPVLNPRPARPSRAAEGATSIASDSTAALTATEIKPETYVSVLPISFETLKYSAANIEAELPAIFAEAFADCMANQVINGRGATTYYEYDGLFTSVPSGNKVACAATGAPTMADLVNLAIKMKDLNMVAPVMFISPTLYAGISTTSVSGYDVYRNELIQNKTIEGVRVVVTGHAPSTTTAGSIVVVGLDMKNYAIGIAADLTIKPIDKVGDTNVYYQAVMGMNGKPIVADNIFGLKTV